MPGHDEARVASSKSQGTSRLSVCLCSARCSAEHTCQGVSKSQEEQHYFTRRSVQTSVEPCRFTAAPRGLRCPLESLELERVATIT